MVRLGVSLTSSLTAPDPRTGAVWLVERAQAAAAAGLDHLSLGDHHATGPAPYYQNAPALGRLLAEWDDRPVGCLFLVPLWHPVLMAEQIGTLAAMAAGPFVVQTGVGGGAAQFAAMGVGLDERRRRIEEGVHAAQRLLGGEEVDVAGHGVEAARIAPVPPEPVTWWMGGTADAALERAARLGDAWYSGPGVTPSEVADLAGRYHGFADRLGRPRGDVAVRQDVIVTAGDGARAESLADELVASGYRGMTRDQVVAGSVDRVTEELARFGPVGATDLVLRCMSVPQDVAVETLTLLGDVRRSLSP